MLCGQNQIIIMNNNDDASPTHIYFAFLYIFNSGTLIYLINFRLLSSGITMSNFSVVVDENDDIFLF